MLDDFKCWMRSITCCAANGPAILSSNLRISGSRWSPWLICRAEVNKTLFVVTAIDPLAQQLKFVRGTAWTGGSDHRNGKFAAPPVFVCCRRGRAIQSRAILFDQLEDT